ncbi:endonuclease-reverse transcriptase [Elysia marginata]|uniref:Endonuclease-reverse transcriptase n=1 Tax=Elysia marginata TaxID=1093978 RepID=A0AAV4I4E2_9GAST|nr:endonuclease-reverse transcriptase [Elysia marginata]
MCGDVESNPGPPKTSRDIETNPTGPTTGKTRRTRQSTLSGSFVNTASPTQNVPSKPTESSNEPCIRDVMNAIYNLTSKVDNFSKSMSDLNHSVKDLSSKYCNLQTQLQDATNSFRRLEDENRDLKERSEKPIIAKISDFKTKTAVVRERHRLKGTNLHITEDFTPRVREQRKTLNQCVAPLRADGYTANLVFDHLMVDGARVNWDYESKSLQPDPRWSPPQQAKQNATRKPVYSQVDGSPPGPYQPQRIGNRPARPTL